MTTPAENAGTPGTPENEAGNASHPAPSPDGGAPDTQGGSQGADPEDNDLDPRVRSKIDKANREAASLRQRVKDLEPLAARLKQIQDGEKSELERAQATLAEREAEVKRLTVDRLRRDAALTAGLSSEFVEFLTGETEDEIAEQAKKLAKHMKPAEAAPPKKPADLRQGQRGSPSGGAVDKDDLIRRMAGFSP